MRLSDDFDERPKRNTTILTVACLAVILFGLFLLLILFYTNNDPIRNEAQNETMSFVSEREETTERKETVSKYPDTNELLSGSTLSPDDLDFWDKYPEQTPEPEVETSESEEEEPELDPSTDGRHTLIEYADGTSEWVLINPYLPKHEYDFTKLVYQSDLMKYYVDGKQTSFVGADISKYQDYVDFGRVKKAGLDFVMLRAGFRGYGSGQIAVDDYFMDNLKRATDAGLSVGVYFFSQAISKEEAVEEAAFVLDLIKDYEITYPIAFDMEKIANDTSRTDQLTRAERTEIAIAFMDHIKSAGYTPMIYGNKEWLIKEVDMSRMSAYDVWYSQTADLPDYPYRFSMWQYSQNATVDGVAGYVDLNVSFIDYSEK